MRNNKIVGLVLIVSIVTVIPVLASENFTVIALSNILKEYCSGYSTQGNSNGYPNDVIDWINIRDALNDYEDELETNHGSYKMAVLDSGFDYGTWDYLENLYPNADLDLHLMEYDECKQKCVEISKANARDDSDEHHGTMMMNTIISLLESAYIDGVEVDASIYMFISGGTYPNSELLEKILQWIYDENVKYPNQRFKVITCSYEATNIFGEEVSDLARDQKCLIVAASGNYKSDYRDDDAEAWGKEWEKTYPASYSEVFGVGSNYGTEGETSFENYRMSAKYNKPHDTKYIGSSYHKDCPLSESTVDLVSPGFKVDTRADIFGGTDPETYEITGTSVSAPQVAVAAYLAARLRYYKTNGNDPLDMYSFRNCIMYTAEEDPAGKDSDYPQYHQQVRKPIEDNYASKEIYYSYKVGYGCLDVHDLMVYIDLVLS